MADPMVNSAQRGILGGRTPTTRDRVASPRTRPVQNADGRRQRWRGRAPPSRHGTRATTLRNMLIAKGFDVTRLDCRPLDRAGYWRQNPMPDHPETDPRSGVCATGIRPWFRTW